jgi:hypothetical protein
MESASRPPNAKAPQAEQAMGLVDRQASWAQDFVAGCLVGLVGAGAAWIGTGYGVGTLGRMQPGFFPVAVGAILASLGLALAIGALKRRPREPAGAARVLETPDWRGWGFIVAGVAAFVGLGHHGGLAPASFACVFISSLGDRTTTWRQAFVLAGAIAAIGSVVFSIFLKVQMPIWTWGSPW